MTRTMTAIAVLGLILGSLLAAAASDEPDSLVPCDFITIRPGKLSGVGARLRFRCGPTDDLPNEPDNDPTVEGGTLRIFDLGGSGGDDTYVLPAADWTRIPANTSTPLRGYRFRAPITPTQPCKVVLVRDNVVRATCKNQAMTLTPPFTGATAIVLTIGTNSKRYCGELGGTTLYNMGKLWRRNAPAPAACSSASGAFLEMGAALVE
jgi:hypothetical protein